MNQTTYRDRAVRSPYQPHPVQPRQKAAETPVPEHPARKEIRRLCEKSLQFSVTFSEDQGALSTLKNPNLIAVRCVLSLDGRAIGIGYGSSILSRINRGERTLLGCLNGSLFSAVNVASKSLDAMRVGETDDERENEKRTLADAYRAKDSYDDQRATDRQKQWLLQLAAINLDEGDREQFAASVDDMTKEEASRAIANWK